MNTFSPFDTPDYCFDDRPIPNSTTPTAFELATLAVPFLAAGKTVDEAFKLAREVFRRAETELESGLVTLSEVRQAELLEFMPDILKERQDECRPHLHKLGIRPPEDSDFPLSFEAFHETVLPQMAIEDRRKYFRSHVQGAECPKGLIPDLYCWLTLFAKVAKLRGWEDRAKIRAEAKKFQARRVAKKYKPSFRRTSMEKSC